MDKLLLVYGSLRSKSKRGFNFNRFGGQKYIRRFMLPGFVMHSFQHYPGIRKIEHYPGIQLGGIVVELHKVEEDAFRQIERMEHGAGYESVAVEVPEGPATIFVCKHDLSQWPIVESGDWN